MKKAFVLIFFTGIAAALAAQGFSGGFRAGLNFSRFDGPTAQDGSGQSVESFNPLTGFSIGATAVYGFTDLVGLKADLMYSQKGAEYVYDGPSYFVFYNPNTGNETLTLAGNRRVDNNIINTYLDLPLQAYFRLGKLEISGGVSMGFLITSQGAGGLRFTPTESSIAPFSVTLDENYLRDSRAAATIKEGESRFFSNKAVNFPTTVGAYYDSTAEDKPLFNRIDMGLVGELSYFMNKGLFLSGRLNYGLSDITRNSQHVSLVQRSSGQYNLREELHRNLALQAGIGFRF